MASADYQTALQNGIDAARSGSRMMARLHLLKAVDFAPKEVGCHLWLAWVAETPADALGHLDDALARNPRHALARAGRAWTQAMADFDGARDSAEGEVDDTPGDTPVTSATLRLAATQRLSSVANSPSASPAMSGAAGDGPREDMTRTVRMEFVQRERADDVDDDVDDADEPPLSQTCFMPTPATKRSTDPQPDAPGSDVPSVDADSPSSLDEPVGPSTIRLDPGAVKRALAESVIAEMTSPERSTHSATACEMVATSSGCDVGCAAADDTASSVAAVNQPASCVDEHNEPPLVAISPDSLEVASASIAPAATGPCVLVVDDSPTVRKLLSSTLESHGYRVASVASGYEAVELLSQTTPDALVLEVDLPRLDGLHLCKLLRSQEATRNTPVIFLTRRDGTMDRMRGKMVGATAYLTKPFRCASLLEELSACCPADAK